MNIVPLESYDPIYDCTDPSLSIDWDMNYGIPDIPEKILKTLSDKLKKYYLNSDFEINKTNQNTIRIQTTHKIIFIDVLHSVPASYYLNIINDDNYLHFRDNCRSAELINVILYYLNSQLEILYKKSNVEFRKILDSNFTETIEEWLSGHKVESLVNHYDPDYACWRLYAVDSNYQMSICYYTHSVDLTLCSVKFADRNGLFCMKHDIIDLDDLKNTIYETLNKLKCET